MRARHVLGCLLGVTAALASSSCSGERVTDLQGSGATFPAPLYKRWFLEYYRAHPEVQTNYQAIGSGAGIRQFSEMLTDFGASDAAMSDKEIAAALEKPGFKDRKKGVLLLPMTAGSVVLAYNVDGVTGSLRLSHEAYSEIFRGAITRWNDPAIQKTNPDIKLPAQDITVIYRSDGSGTTFAFTNHLSAISPAFKKSVGVGKSVEWPTGLGGRGNSGVTALVQQTPGAIGYLEYGYAELAGLPMAVLENRAGKFVAPGPESGKAALAGVKEIPANLRIFIPDPMGEEAYPIVTYTWMLCYRHYEDARKAQAFKALLRYCLTDGQRIAGELGYIPLPENVATRVLAAAETIEP
jgi:phosphate transport system substrate-binding protein